MKERIKSSAVKYYKGPSTKYQDDKPDKREPTPDDPYEETGPPIKEIPITGISSLVHPLHPHNEEILD